ncbi:MAG: helix-turn-helix domain-containing protein [Novosphingobium sp.]
MSRSSPGVWRVAAILNFIADHPGQAFALTDLVRALKLSRATCHALLTGLVEVGYLYRTGDKTYVLGPALTAIGRTAAEHFSPLQVAKPEMRAIADGYDVVCGAYFLEGDVLHLRDRAASASHVAYPVPLGTRMKLRSAQAVVYYAWSQADAEAWLARAEPPPSPDKAKLMFDSMAFAREHGFVVLVRNPGVIFGEPNAELLSSADTDELPVVPVAAVEPGGVYPVAALMAPVFDAKGKVCFTLVMAGFHSAITGTQALDAGETLRSACQRISDFVAGRGQTGATIATTA